MSEEVDSVTVSVFDMIVGSVTPVMLRVSVAELPTVVVVPRVSDQGL